MSLTEGMAARDAGIEQAQYSLPGWNISLLEEARGLARTLAYKNGTVTADDVVKVYRLHGIDLTAKLGNAMGSLFRDSGWRWTGKYIKSKRAHAHANLLRVWERNI
jgi:hypothetical protein